MLDGYPAMCGLLANQGVLLGGSWHGRNFSSFMEKRRTKQKEAKMSLLLGRVPAAFIFHVSFPLHLRSIQKRLVLLSIPEAYPCERERQRQRQSGRCQHLWLIALGIVHSCFLWFELWGMTMSYVCMDPMGEIFLWRKGSFIF